MAVCSGDPGRDRSFLVLTTFEVEVVHLGVGVGVRTIETDTFQCGGDEAEVALIGQFYAQQVGVAGVFGLGELLVFVVLIGVVTDNLIDDKVIDLFVENTCADQTDTFEVVVCAEVEVVGDGRGQVGVTHHQFVVAAVDVDTGDQCRVFRAAQCLGERSAEL